MVLMLCTTMAFHPDTGAVCVMFLFPDGHGGFDRVDYFSACCKGGVTVGGAHGDADGNFSYLKVARAVGAASFDDIVLVANSLDDSIPLFLCEGREGFVF